MNVVAIVGSPRKMGNTELMAAYALKAIGEEGIETEIVPLDYMGQPFSSPFANRFRPSRKLAGIQRSLKKFEFIEE